VGIWICCIRQAQPQVPVPHRWLEVSVRHGFCTFLRLSDSHCSGVYRSAHKYKDAENPEADPRHVTRVHPLVRTSPATGWKSLYVNQAMTVGIEGLDKKESDAILNHLYESVLPPHLLKAPEDCHTDASGHGPNQCV
jgi:hypothetical protein